MVEKATGTESKQNIPDYFLNSLILTIDPYTTIIRSNNPKIGPITRPTTAPSPNQLSSSWRGCWLGARVGGKEKRAVITVAPSAPASDSNVLRNDPLEIDLCSVCVRLAQRAVALP
eukprot:scaffold6156_cov179-Ochromonas_danica.AAC.4